jgi:hypothetical protein
MFADANFAPAFWNSLVISGTGRQPVGTSSAPCGHGAWRGSEPRARYLVTTCYLPLMLQRWCWRALLSFYSRATFPWVARP